MNRAGVLAACFTLVLGGGWAAKAANAPPPSLPPPPGTTVKLWPRAMNAVVGGSTVKVNADLTFGVDAVAFKRVHFSVTKGKATVSKEATTNSSGRTTATVEALEPGEIVIEATCDTRGCIDHMTITAVKN